jgi:hypothetical protein
LYTVTPTPGPISSSDFGGAEAAPHASEISNAQIPTTSSFFITDPPDHA